ncbi:MAG: T9SS type A sorting domain-containing protein [Candidatus Zixiibacteriota bacterium]
MLRKSILICAAFAVVSACSTVTAQQIDTFLVVDTICVGGSPVGVDGYGDYLWFVDYDTDIGYRIDLEGNIISSGPVPPTYHASGCYVDADYVYLGPLLDTPPYYAIVKYDWDWNVVDTLLLPTFSFYRSEDMAFDPTTGRWWIAERYGDVYSWEPSEGSLSWEFHHDVSVAGDHLDGIEVVPPFVYISEMFTDTIFQYDMSGTCIIKYTYTGEGEAVALEGMGFDPRGNFWYSAGWTTGCIYELGGIRVSVQIAITPDTVTVDPGEMADFTVLIMNVGSEEDDYVMGLSGLPGDFTCSLPDTVWDVPGSDTAELPLGITPPYDLAIWVDTQYPFAVACTSLTDPEVSHTTSGTVIILAQATPGSRVRYTDILLDSLIAQVGAASIEDSVKHSLLVKLYNAERKKHQGLDYLEAGDATKAVKMFNAAANIMGAFINETEAQRGKKVLESDADSFITQAEDIIWRLQEGIWEEIPPSPKTAHENSQIPSGFELSQNYPNPFNPVTQISYTLPQDGCVALNIYNVLGQKVATLVDEYQEAGRKTLDWEAKGLSSGIYFYRLSVGDFTDTKKMLLTK